MGVVYSKGQTKVHGGKRSVVAQSRRRVDMNLGQ